MLEQIAFYQVVLGPVCLLPEICTCYQNEENMSQVMKFHSKCSRSSLLAIGRKLI